MLTKAIKHLVLVYDKLMRRLKKRVNLHGATAHVLRHTYLTILASEGVDPKTLQTIADHANIQTTLNIYAHVTKQQQRETADKFSQFMQA